MLRRQDASVSDLASAIAHYENVATTFSRQQVKCFIRDVRAHFEPLHETWEDPNGEIWPDIQEIRKDGYTVDGAIARRVYENGFPYERYEPAPDASAAEKAGQILSKTPESALDQLTIVRQPPYSDAEVARFRLDLTAYLQAQATEVGLRDFHLPDEFFACMRLARDIGGAGMPGWNGSWRILSTMYIPSHTSPMSSREAPNRSHLDFWSGMANLDTLLYWQIGSQENSHQEVWYCFSRENSSPEQALRWRIMERWDVELETYDSLSEFLNKTAAELERKLAMGEELEEEWRTCWEHCLY